MANELMSVSVYIKSVEFKSRKTVQLIYQLTQESVEKFNIW